MSVLEAVVTRPAAGEEKERLSSVRMADSKLVTQELESKKNYPYGLRENPFAVAPKTIRDGSVIFGGDIHRTAKNSFVAWLKRIQLESATNAIQASDICPLLIVHGEQGTGKTQLGLLIKNIAENAVVSFVDLPAVNISEISEQKIFEAVLTGFGAMQIRPLRQAIINYLLDLAERNIGTSRKVFNYDFVDVMSNRSLADKAQMVLACAMPPNEAALFDVLRSEFSESQIRVARAVLEGKLDCCVEAVGAGGSSRIEQLAALSSLNIKFLNKITLVELDGFSTQSAILDFVKKVIGCNIAGLAMAVMTRSSVVESLEKDGSITETLAKSERIDLVPFSIDELTDIILEHIRECDIDNHLTIQAKLDLEIKIKLVCEEFPGLTNIDSILRIMRYCFEDAAIRGLPTIDDHTIEQAIKNTHPSLCITDSIIEVPFSEFMRIKRNYAEGQINSYHIRTAVRDLMTYSHQVGMIGRPIWTDGGIDKNDTIDLVYRDNGGNSVAVALVMTGGLQHCEIKTDGEEIANRILAAEFADKVVILTDKDYDSQSAAPIVKIDRRKVVELIHFSNKYRNSEFTHADSDKITNLARSINLC